MEALFVLLNAIAPMSPELQAYLSKILQRVEFKRSQVILEEGQLFPWIYFIETGLVRIYQMDRVDVTIWFLMEGDLFISPASFFRGMLSADYITALEDCVCWGITREQLLEVCKLFPEFLIHRIFITEEYYLRDLDRRTDMQLKKAVERYAALAGKSPGLLNRVPVKLLASYLGVGISTFHKARKDYPSYERQRK